MGFICLCNLLINTWMKLQSKTLIFMLNPCHIVNLFLVIVSVRDHDRFGELCALAVYSFAFGGYIGVIFNENEGFDLWELLVYHCEHAFASWLGPLILSLTGRYDFLSYVKFPLPWFGFAIFTIYERYILMPTSAVTWANLNHSLCGVDNDPFYKMFDLGKSYYFWADFYLLGSCLVGFALNYFVVSVGFFVRGLMGLEKVKKID
jgi:TMEM164 family